MNVDEGEHALRRKRVASSIGIFIRETREEKGLSQDSVARISGLSTHAYGCLERGVSPSGRDANPTIDTLLRVSEALEIDLYAIWRIGIRGWQRYSPR
ncbi:helix-turn-helix transcriptional regulator [Microbacterium sp. RURRCA19A]|uniref:helix-turn-helix domain-containing protein n=1 Tax=Microbacterium sp. RURRCA19A TaxID=1907391 RepID=UPI0009708F38